ncbi:cell wall elongation regulator TseB-like domain-containing protein [Gracilibacillus sp. Marseille-QA3620]
MKKVIWSIIILLLIGIGLLVQAIYAGDHDKQNAKEKAVKTATETANLTETADFYLYNGNETWSVVTGVNDEGKKVGVWIPDNKKEESKVLALSEGLSEKEAISLVKNKKKVKKIMAANLGMENGTALWEVIYKNNDDLYGYYYLNFKTGDLIRNYDNL